MKRLQSVFLSFIFAISFVFCFAGCEKAHVCDFSLQTASEEYLCKEADCFSPATYYYHCSCGKHGDKYYEKGTKKQHYFKACIEEERYIAVRSEECFVPDIYYKSCIYCGPAGTATFVGSNEGEHLLRNTVDLKYLKEEATYNSPAVYYKSCPCGDYPTGEEDSPVFYHGNPLKDYTEEEKLDYKPTSVTVSLYDTENLTYSFNYVTKKLPQRPVLYIEQGNELTGNATEIFVNFTVETTFTQRDEEIPYYVCKVKTPLLQNQTYAYKICDKYVNVETPVAIINTPDLESEGFTFSHVSDTQTYTLGDSENVSFTAVLKNTFNSDFLLHTGDVVEYSKYEDYLEDMLDRNKEYLMQKPVMPISGNHETTYRNGKKETDKHFYINHPAQDGVNLGFYYSFVYKNAKFIMLNSNDLSANKLKSEQLSWLINELENNTSKWLIVAIHNPLYSAGSYGSNPERNHISLALRSQLKDIFARYKVDLVLQGHDHLTSRTYPLSEQGFTQEEIENIGGVDYSVNPNGTIYLMNGAAGNQTRKIYGHDDEESMYDLDGTYSYVYATHNCSYADITVTNDSITVSANYVSSGQVKTYTSWGIIKR